MMKEQTEVKLAKWLTFIIILLTILQAKLSFGATQKETITRLFKHYNRKLTITQLNTMTDSVIVSGTKYKVSPLVIASIIVRESGARPNVISKGGDYGLMQVRYKVHRDKVKSAKALLNIETNIDIGTRIFADYYARRKTLYGALYRYSGGNRTLAQRVLRTLHKLQKGQYK
ncbi:MAG: lytic transglycosylase domain-containing protein [Synergistaceae bacterium]|nr:lytic transglycosylase domain-containing protein [Synergistaceae bacterium]